MIESLEREIRDLRSLFWSERDPDGRGFAPLADAYRRAGDFRQALELVNDGLDRLPGFATGHVVSASVHLDAGLMEEAQLAASRALELDAENVWALRALAEALTAQGDETGAADARSRLSALEPPEEPAAEVTAEPAADAEQEPVAETVEEVAAEEAPAPNVEPLAPEEPEAVEEEAAALDIGALAPEPQAADEEDAVALDIGALAPEEPEAAAEEEAAALDIGAFAPEEPEAVEEEAAALDIGAFAPEEPEAAAEEEAAALDIGALAPEEPEEAAAEEEAAALDIGAFAPEEPEATAAEEETPVMDIGALAPEESADTWDAEPEATEPPIYTRTMAELYVRQGLTEQAIDVYRRLIEGRPDDPELQARLAELEAGEAEEDLEESEIQARHLAAAGERGPKVETPFAWTEEEASDTGAEAPPISRYFRRMLDWTSDEDRA